jgi:hypothetical protein
MHGTSRSSGLLNKALRSSVPLIVGFTLLGGAVEARAQGDPDGCFGASVTLGINIFRADGLTGVVGTVSPCETVVYRVSLNADTSSGACAFQHGTLSLTTPDGVNHTLASGGGIPCLGGHGDNGSGCINGQSPVVVDFTYQITPADGPNPNALVNYNNGELFQDVPPTPNAVNAGIQKNLNVAPCAAAQDCVNAGVCNANEVVPLPGVNRFRKGVCDAPVNKPNSTPCPDTDHSACTTAGCDAGVCNQNHVVATCNPSANDCVNNPVCDPADGVCKSTNKADSTPCADTDGSACTTAGCNGAGVCDQHHVVKTCNPSTNECVNDAVCDPADGTCKSTNKADSTPCADSDGSACTTAGCNGAGVCDQHHIVKTCNPSTNECVNDAVCDPADGVCKSTNKPDSTPCTDSDGSACTTAGCNGAGVCDQGHIINQGPTCKCGNGVLDPGETCEPPGSMVAAKSGGPADRLCRADCTYCGDQIVNDSETCDDGDTIDGDCAPINNCRNDCSIPICGDPAEIKFRNPPQFDFFNVYGRIIPIASFNPSIVPVSFTLTDQQGNVRLSESLQAGQFVSGGKSWRFHDTSARTQGGIKSWTISPHNVGYTFRIQAYGSFRDVTSLMKGTLTIGSAQFTVDGKWIQKPNGWVLLLKNATPH